MLAATAAGGGGGGARIQHQHSGGGGGFGRQPGGRRRGHNWSKPPSGSKPPRPPGGQQQQSSASLAYRRTSNNGSAGLHGNTVELAHAASVTSGGSVGQQQQHEDGKQQTLRSLLDAVGQVQHSSGRADMMFPLQYASGPVPSKAGGGPGLNGKAAGGRLQLTYTPVSAAAATLLAVVPSLDSINQMLAGQAGVVACLNGSSPSLFR
jgi:hypothetical protein